MILKRLGPVVSIASLLLTDCRSDSGASFVEQERVNVVGWTLPPSASMSGGAELRRTAQKAEATWEISTPMTWRQYRSWSEERSKTGYRETRTDDAHLSFKRLLPGDQLLVDIALVAPGPPLRLRVTFTAQAD